MRKEKAETAVGGLHLVGRDSCLVSARPILRRTGATRRIQSCYHQSVGDRAVGCLVLMPVILYVSLCSAAWGWTEGNLAARVLVLSALVALPFLGLYFWLNRR